LQLFMEPDSVSGDGAPISVATAPDGQHYLQVENEDPAKLQRLPGLDRQGDEIHTGS